MHKLAERTKSIEPFHVMKLLARAKQLEAEGKDIIHLEVGEPDFPTPKPVVDAAREALDKQNNFYTPAQGLPELREKLAKYYLEHFGVAISAERILITPGASGALLLALSLLLDSGDSVLIPEPGYPCNRHFVKMLGGRPVPVAQSESRGFQLEINSLRAQLSRQTRAVMVASPNNPTGALLSAFEMDQLLGFCDDNSLELIVDEIYQGLTYKDELVHSILNLTDQAFVINSFSKYFNMTGWRLGWLVAPEWAVNAADKLAQNLFLAAPTLAQHAALRALDEDVLAIYEDRREELKQRRDFLFSELSQLGFNFPAQPEGAFYLYADASRFTDNSFAFCYNMLEKAGVGITPGADFGGPEPSRYLRFAYTCKQDRLAEALIRLKQFL